MKTKNQMTIFSTGVHLQAVECSINERKQWRWVAVGFEDESFMHGQAINPFEYAETQEGLVEEY